eukprot:1183677-Prorocentrum_minimum.AAC.1
MITGFDADYMGPRTIRTPDYKGPLTVPPGGREVSPHKAFVKHIHAFPFREESREIEVGRFLEGSSKQPRFPEYNAITLYKPKKTKVSLCRNSNHGTFKFTPCRNLGAHSEVTQITTAPKIYFNRVQLPWFPHLFTPYSLSKLSSRFLLYSEDQLNFNASLCELNVIRIPSLDYAVLNHFEHKLHDQKRTENLMKKVYAIKDAIYRSRDGDLIVWTDTDVFVEHFLDDRFLSWTKAYDVMVLPLFYKNRDVCARELGFDIRKLLSTCRPGYETGIIVFRVSSVTRQLISTVWEHYSQANVIQAIKTNLQRQPPPIGPSIYNLEYTLNDVAVFTHVINKFWLERRIRVGYLAAAVSRRDKGNWTRHARLYKDAASGVLLKPQQSSPLISPFNIFYYFMHFRGITTGLANCAMQSI